MSRKHIVRVTAAAAVAMMAGGALAACSPGSTDGVVEISYVVQSDATSVAGAERVIDAFNSTHEDIRVVLNSQPAGGEGDNLVKTKLATGEMDDIFNNPTGSLMHALNPDETLVDLSGEDWMQYVTDDFISTASTDKGVYGAPQGTSLAGGVLYNIPLYEELGLEIPTSWDEFIANNEAIKAAKPDVAPVLQAFGDTWTSQLIVLASYAAVQQEDPTWAESYTANEAKFADEPALEGFEHQQDLFDRGLLNKDFSTMTNGEAQTAVATGTGAHYPMLTNAIGGVLQNTPDNVDDVGYFAMPADDAQYTAATIWQPNALFIPKSTTGPELEAAKTFIGWLMTSEEACTISQESAIPSGPYVISTCELAGDVPRVVKDVEPYFESGKTAPALEFLSPIKGPNLENLTVEAGSGIKSAKEAAAAYDEDVKKQAQQLGLDGW